MIYECIGLPGAGKSYIASQKCQQKHLTEIKISGPKERLLRALLFACQHPFFFTRLLFVFAKENRKNYHLLKHKFSTVILEIAAREQKAEAGIVMVETGFFQLFLSLYERKINEYDVADFMTWLKKRPYMVYIIEARTDVREKRMQARGRVPRSGIISDSEKLAEWFRMLEYNFNVVKEVIENNFNYELIQNN